MRRSNFFKSRNPVMNEEAYRKASSQTLDGDLVREGRQAATMTVQGAINKSFILAGLMLLTAVIGFMYPSNLFMWGGAIGGLIVVLIASFKPHLSPTLAPVYAALEGLFVGAITAVYAFAFDGIVFNAISLTIAMLFLMLFIYKAEIIKVTQKFRAGMLMAIGSIFIIYMLTWILSMFGINMPYLHGGGMVSIGISLVIVGVASLSLLLDFDNFEKGEQYGAPKYMEWFSAMGLLITLVWLYFEILRLLSYITSND